MFSRSIRPLTLVVTGLAIISCTDETTAPDLTTDNPALETSPDLASEAMTASRWTPMADMPSTERARLATAMVPNTSGQSVLYVIGGSTTSSGASLSKVMAYNAATNTWTYKASLPVPLYWTNGTGVINGKIYISGGLSAYKRYRAELYMYDPAKNTWTEKQRMPNTTFRGVTGVINNQLYVLTGCDQEDCEYYVPTAFYRYNPVTDQWTTLTAPPSGYYGWASGGTIGGKLYVTGQGDGGALLMMYDPATDTWTRKTPLNHVRIMAASATVAAKLYVIGGNGTLSDGSSGTLRTVSIYDPATDSWTNKAPLPEPRFNLSASRVLVNGRARIQLVGGPRPGNNLQYTP